MDKQIQPIKTIIFLIGYSYFSLLISAFFIFKKEKREKMIKGTKKRLIIGLILILFSLGSILQLTYVNKSEEQELGAGEEDARYLIYLIKGTGLYASLEALSPDTFEMHLMKESSYLAFIESGKIDATSYAVESAIGSPGESISISWGCNDSSEYVIFLSYDDENTDNKASYRLEYHYMSAFGIIAAIPLLILAAWFIISSFYTLKKRSEEEKAVVAKASKAQIIENGEVKTVNFCSICHKKVAEEAAKCPHCGAFLQWHEDMP